MLRSSVTPPAPGWDPHLLHPSDRRRAVIADLVRSFEAYFAEHRTCDGLAGGLVEVTESGLLWGAAWMECSDCGVSWERWLAV